MFLLCFQIPDTWHNLPVFLPTVLIKMSVLGGGGVIAIGNSVFASSFASSFFNAKLLYSA